MSSGEYFLMRIISTAALAAVLVVSTSAFAQNSSQTATAATTSASQSKAATEEKKVCKRLETSGTRMAERVCLTKEEWKKVEQQMSN
jgi:Spy/CpxP family protein refolding chaperone